MKIYTELCTGFFASRVGMWSIITTYLNGWWNSAWRRRRRQARIVTDCPSRETSTALWRRMLIPWCGIVLCLGLPAPILTYRVRMTLTMYLKMTPPPRSTYRGREGRWLVMPFGFCDLSLSFFPAQGKNAKRAQLLSSQSSLTRMGCQLMLLWLAGLRNPKWPKGCDVWDKYGYLSHLLLSFLVMSDRVNKCLSYWCF